MSEFHTAAEHGDTEKVLALLHAGIDVEAEDDMGYTALRLASAGGHIGIVKALLEHGANTNAADEAEFYTALMGASANGHTEIVSLLLNHGADVNAKDDYDATALTRAAEHGYLEIV